MKMNIKLLVGVLLTAGFALLVSAQSNRAPAPFGAERNPVNYINITIKNHQNETLGRITDMGVDLVNGRIVVVLVRSDRSLKVGRKVVAVPPGALSYDADVRIFRLNASRELFSRAAAINLSKWEEFGRSERVAASYHLFGQEPYFLEEGEMASRTDARPKVSLGYVQRAHLLKGMPVGNYRGDHFGEVWTMTMDILKGRILSVIVQVPGNYKTKYVIPAMALEFNAKRNALLLDDTVEEFAREPRYVYTPAANGNDGISQEQSYQGERTMIALEQGDSHRDIDCTLLIHQHIREAKIYRRHIQVGTMDDRVTLRGWVSSDDDRQRVGEIAISASSLELVDNQLTVGRPFHHR